jgi:hypothetical protein
MLQPDAKEENLGSCYYLDLVVVVVITRFKFQFKLKSALFYDKGTDGKI